MPCSTIRSPSCGAGRCWTNWPSVLEHKREQYRTLEQNAGRIWVQNFPEMWRLTFSQEEAADRDKELQQEKAEWLECMPATRWVSRLPRRVMEQFRVGRNEYDYGLMIEADAARRLGLKRTKHVEVVCGGDYLTTIWKKDYRGSFGWDSLDDLHAGDRAARVPCGGRDLQQHRC